MQSIAVKHSQTQHNRVELKTVCKKGAFKGDFADFGPKKRPLSPLLSCKTH